MTRHNRGLKQGTDLAYGKRRVCTEMVSYHHALVAVYRISVIGLPGTLDVVAFRTIRYRDQTVCPHCNCFNQMQEFGLYLADALSSDKTLLRYNVSNFLNSATTRTLPLESASPQVRVCMRAAMGLSRLAFRMEPKCPDWSFPHTPSGPGSGGLSNQNEGAPGPSLLGTGEETPPRPTRQPLLAKIPANPFIPFAKNFPPFCRVLSPPGAQWNRD
jgi:hypothetical protein